MFNAVEGYPTATEIELNSRRDAGAMVGELAELYTKCVICCASIVPVRVINHDTELLIQGEPRTEYRLTDCPDCKRKARKENRLPVLPIPPSCLGLTWSHAMRRGS